MKSKRLGLPAARLLAAVTLLCTPIVAWSAVIVGSPSNVTGITGLTVGATTYNVSFSTNNYNTTFASESPTFFGDGSGAADAASAIASLFLSAGVTGIDGADCNTKPAGVTNYFHCIVMAPDQVSGPNFSAAYADRWINPDGSITDWFGTGADSINLPLTQNLGLLSGNPYLGAGSGGQFFFAVFTAASTAVPEPGTLALLGLGLAGLGLTRRRKAV